MKKSYLFLAIIFAFILIFDVGCSDTKSEDQHIAYISPNPDSDYVKTFKDLNLGILYDFDLKLTHADQSWVKIWIEGYRHGKKLNPFHLIELGYGIGPKQVEEGYLDLGIINLHSQHPLFFISTPGGSNKPHKIENNLNFSEGISTWDYAIGDEKTALAPGKTKIIGVYRQAKGSMETLNPQNPNDIQKMINEDETVLLLKIQVEKRNKVPVTK